MAAITAELVARLRAETDEPMMTCKKALVEFEGNYDKALSYLRDTPWHIRRAGILSRRMCECPQCGTRFRQ